MPAVELFRRQWRVTIDPPGGQGKEWDDLDIKFKVTKTGTNTPNKLELGIYNLSDDSQSFVEKKGMAVILEAGYEDELNTLFSGELELATHLKGGNHGQREGKRIKNGSDWLTEIEGSDGGSAYRTIMHESFGPGTTEASVIRAIAKKMAVSIGTLKGLSDEPFRKGRQLSGPARLQLESLCRSRKLRWSIQDGTLQILPVGGSRNTSPILIDPSSGLVGSPEKTEKGGLQLTTLLRGSLNPGDLIRVESRAINGNYVVEKVEHEGDTTGQPWYSHLLCLKA